jgi:hypothetical protein
VTTCSTVVALSEAPRVSAPFHLQGLHHGVLPLFSQPSAPSLTYYSISIEPSHHRPSGTSFRCGIGLILAQMCLETPRSRASRDSTLPASFSSRNSLPLLSLAVRKRYMEFLGSDKLISPSWKHLERWLTAVYGDRHGQLLINQNSELVNALNHSIAKSRFPGAYDAHKSRWLVVWLFYASKEL